MQTLPLPAHYAPDKVGHLWRVPYERRATDAEEWARQYAIRPAAEDEFRIALVAVDEDRRRCSLERGRGLDRRHAFLDGSGRDVRRRTHGREPAVFARGSATKRDDGGGDDFQRGQGDPRRDCRGRRLRRGDRPAACEAGAG